MTRDVRLLAAAFLSGDDAMDAWEEWRVDVDIEALPPESYALLPQLYRNLTDQGVEDPLLSRIAGVYRHSWYANQRLLARAVEGVQALGTAGIDAQLAGGTALALTCYADSGARRLQAAEVLVDTRAAARAAMVLRRAGWQHTRGLALGLLRLAVRHRTTLRHPTGELLLLRRGSLPGSRTLEVHGVEIRVPPVEVQLKDAWVDGGNGLADLLAAASVQGRTATRSASINRS